MLLTTDEVKQKIIKIIDETVEDCCSTNIYLNDENLAVITDKFTAVAESIANKLIKAGIGDVSDAEQRQNLLLTAANNFEEKMKAEQAKTKALVQSLTLANISEGVIAGNAICPPTKTEYKVITCDGHELQKRLNFISENGYTLFNIYSYSAITATTPFFYVVAYRKVDTTEED